MGAIGIASHFPELRTGQAFQNDVLWIDLIQVLAIVAGIWLLRGRNWARWLALAWMAFHVILSVFHSWVQVLVHTVFFAVIAFILFRPVASRYFRHAAPNPAGS
jgi:hypothetical protein